MKEKSPIVKKPEPTPTPDLATQIQSLLQLQEQAKAKELWRDEVTIQVQTRGLPFMVVPLSDLHIGSGGVNYNKLKEYFDFIKNYPVYTVLLGDLADNFSPIKHPIAIKEDLVTPTDQWQLVRAFFKEHEQKVLVTISGNHDEWMGLVGLDIYRWLAEDLSIPLLKGGGVLNLQVDNQLYKVRLFHKIARLNSQFNYTHAGKQAIRLAGDDVDAIISGDKHLGSFEQTYIGDKKRTIVQLGTFKEEDGYGRSMGFVQRPRPFFPVLFFHQGQHNIEVVEDLHQAKEYIDAFKKFYKIAAIGHLGIR
jgi:hypothetical protein